MIKLMGIERSSIQKLVRGKGVRSIEWMGGRNVILQGNLGSADYLYR